MKLYKVKPGSDLPNPKPGCLIQVEATGALYGVQPNGDWCYPAGFDAKYDPQTGWEKEVVRTEEWWRELERARGPEYVEWLKAWEAYREEMKARGHELFKG